jgi:hypothetical protein
MGLGRRTFGRLGRLGLVLAVVAGVFAAVAPAASVKSGTYNGKLNPNSSVKIKIVAKHGKATASISNIPLFCSGGGPAIPIHFPTVAISRSGAFRTSYNHKITVGPRKGQLGTKLQLSGTFSGSHVQGVLETSWIGNTICSGRSIYTAKK